MRIVDWGGGLTARARRSLARAVAVLLLGNAAALVAVPDGSTSPAAPTEAAGDPLAAGDGGEAPTRAAPNTPTTTAASSSRPAGGGEGGDAEGADPQAATTTTTTAAAALPAPGSEWKGDYRFEITLEPTCARVGELFTVTVRVERDANVALIAAHADGQTYGTRQVVTAPEDGVVVRSWRAPPAPGPGRLLVGSSTPGGRSGGTPVDFRVVEATGSC